MPCIKEVLGWLVYNWPNLAIVKNEYLEKPDPLVENLTFVKLPL